MSFSGPWALSALLVIPLLVAAWWWWRRRRRRVAVRVSSIALVRAAVPGRASWRRRIPVALLMLGLIVLGIGAARPRASVPVASTSTTIMLALDVSGSMCSTDVPPNRITAAERAAAGFIKSQGGGPRVGLVTFAGTAAVLVPPTTDTNKLLGALSGLTTSFGTAIGQGILTSLDSIAQVDHSVAPTGAHVSGNRSGAAEYSADAVVLLTDGANTQGVDPQTAARAAAERGVRVYTIGFGTNSPASLACDTSQFGGFGNGAGFVSVLQGAERRAARARVPQPSGQDHGHPPVPRHRVAVRRRGRADHRRGGRAVPVVERAEKAEGAGRQGVAGPSRWRGQTGWARARFRVLID
jgi:Ca-activated chloride channel family protein